MSVTCCGIKHIADINFAGINPNYIGIVTSKSSLDSCLRKVLLALIKSAIVKKLAKKHGKRFESPKTGFRAEIV